MSYTFVFDLDGTITREEALPALARCLGNGEEMQQRTATAMQMETPFAPDFLQRVALLQALPLAQARQVICSLARFEEIVSFIGQHKKSCLIVTGNLDVYIQDFLQEIGMDTRCISSVGMAQNGKLLAVRKVIDKAEVVRNLPRPLVCIGDGSNDVGMIATADIGIAFGGAHPVSPQLQQVADYYFTDEHALCDFLQTLC
ncbi:MAG: HAD-IB family phosphatase [Faecalibacterium sp.]